MKSRADRLWLLFLLVWVFLSSLGPVIEFDIWFRLRLGQEILAHGLDIGEPNFLWPQPALPPFITPRFDRFFSVLVTLLYRALGVAAFPSIVAGLLVVMFFLLWKTLERTKLDPPFRVALLGLTFELMRSRLMLRPQLVTDIALAGLLYLYFRDRERPIPRLPLLIGVYFFAWTSLHPGAAIGLPVLFCLFGAQDIFALRFPRRLVSLFSAALLGALVAPGGLGQLVAVLQHVNSGVDHPYNIEWLPMTVASLRGPIGAYLGLHLIAWTTGFVAWRRGLAPNYPVFATVSAGVWLLAILQVRAVGELAAATPALLAETLLAAAPLQRLSGRALNVVVGLALALGLAQQAARPGLFQVWPGDFYPDAALARIAKENPDAGIFCSYHWGGYLVFRGLQPYVHGMTTYFPPQRFTGYLATLQSPTAGQELKAEGYGWVLLAYNSFDDAHMALAHRLADPNSGWGLVFFDDASMLFGPSPASPYLALDPSQPNPIVGSPEAAEAEVVRLEKEWPAHSPLALQLRAQIAEKKGEPEVALRLWNELLTLHPDRWTGRLARGVLLFKKGQFQPSQADLEAYVGAQPESAIGHFDLAMVMLQRARAENSESLLRQGKSELDAALRLNPKFEAAATLRSQLN